LETGKMMWAAVRDYRLLIIFFVVRRGIIDVIGTPRGLGQEILRSNQRATRDKTEVQPALSVGSLA
jgi:hypothetical protein